MGSFGQFRRPQLNSYSIQRQMQLGTTPTDTDVTFYDICGDLSGNNIINNQNCYYLNFGVRQRQDSEQVFTLKLKNTTQIVDNQQIIEEFRVAQGNSIIYFEIILSPNATYNQILWNLTRIPLDYRIQDQQGRAGRIMDVTINEYTELVNVVTFLKTAYPGLKHLTQIGIQGPTSLLMCINRQQIRLGRNGIYEINNGMNIASVNFVPKDSLNGLDYFIMDFKY